MGDPPPFLFSDLPFNWALTSLVPEVGVGNDVWPSDVDVSEASVVAKALTSRQKENPHGKKKKTRSRKNNLTMGQKEKDSQQKEKPHGKKEKDSEQKENLTAKSIV